MAKRFLSPREFARETGLSEKTVRRRLKSGSLPALQAGGPRTLIKIDYHSWVATFPSEMTPAEGPTSATHGHDDLTPGEQTPVTGDQVIERISGPQPRWMGVIYRKTPRGHGPKESKRTC
jgi:hypothetical protein